MKVAAIIPAAGIGMRMESSISKQFVKVAGTSVLVRTLQKFISCELIQTIQLVLRKTEIESFKKEIECLKMLESIRFVEGGETRQESVYRGFKAVEPDTNIVVIHDGVRPFVEVEMIKAIIRTAGKKGSAITVLSCFDTVKEINRDLVVNTLPREKIVMVQTPQAFKYEILKESFERAEIDGFQGTDESSLVERLGFPVTVLLGSERNIKITKPTDLPLAELYAQEIKFLRGDTKVLF